MPANQTTEGSVQLRIVRGPVDSLSLYEITDYELELLEEGSPSSTFLNFAIFFVSIGASFLTTLLTVDISSIYIFSVFVILTITGFAASLVLFQLWRKTRSKTKDLCKKIRARVPIAPISEPIDTPPPPDGPAQSSS
ncbi:MAG: hypothetical protein ACO1PN_09520 [Betaproteobacteria bacterium]